MFDQPIIGILGGMGPHAGVDLVQKIIAQTVAHCDQDHISVALLSYPDMIPDRANHINDPTKPDPAAALVKILAQLQLLGAKVAGLPCVTAHSPALFTRLQTHLHTEKCPIRLLSMVEETARFIQTELQHIRKVAAIVSSFSADWDC